MIFILREKLACQCSSPVSSPNKQNLRIMDPRPGRDKRARTNEVERKRIWDALIADNRQLLRPDENQPEEDLYCLVCSQVLRGTCAKYAVATAVGHMRTNIHQKKVVEVNAGRALNNQPCLPDFVERTPEQHTGQARNIC